LDQINALADWPNATVFNERERAALTFVDQAAKTGEVDDTIFEATGKVFSTQEIVELAVLVSWYVGNAHFVRTLRIAPQIDPTQKK
jgi:alkylhydroperoxidase family enzyme